MPNTPHPHITIEKVEPSVDGGRYAAKRIVGDPLLISADIFKDGHDLLQARALVRAPGDSRWTSHPMEYRYDADRWFVEVVLDRIGLWSFAVEAWPDDYGTWREDLRKRVDAGQDVASELLEGGLLLERIAAQMSSGQAAKVRAYAARLTDPGRSPAERVALALDETAIDPPGRPADPASLTRYDKELEVVVDRTCAVFGAWYELFPRSQSSNPSGHGTFVDVRKRLPALAELAFDIVYLPPIHPIGRTHRKGPDNAETAAPSDLGSPWAIGAAEGGHTAVHPELGSIDDFDRLVADADKLGLEIALDYALQCSPDHPWVSEHPDWFHVRQDGTIRYAENPPKKYEDIYPLNFWCADREGLWGACRDIVIFWIEHGVRIFRVDNPHTKPFSFWEWMIADVRAVHPDVVFLAEAFTRPKRMQALAKLGFTQSYTHFTWKNTTWELRDLLTELTKPEVAEYFRPNLFVNTPDILHEYLQTGGRPAFRVRLLLAATLSPAYGIYSGYELCENRALRPGSEEYLGSEKYQIRVRDWKRPGNINDDIRTLNRLRREHPALQCFANIEFLASTNDQVLAYHKHHDGESLVIVVNVDPHHTHESFIDLPLERLGIAADEPFEVHDLLSGDRHRWRGARNYVKLDPQVRPGHLLRLEMFPYPPESSR